MATTRCKVRCQSVTKKLIWGGQGNVIGYEANFTGAPGDSPENKAFFDATPAIDFKVATIRGDHFDVGKEYYVDFVSVE